MNAKSDIHLSSRVQSINPSPTLAVSARAAQLRTQGKDIISLSAGEPDFDTPESIKQAAIEAIRAGQTKYTAVDGTAALKNAIQHKFARDNQLHYEANQILVSAGAKHSLFNLFQALLDPGDEVIIPAPYWVSYPDLAILAEARPVICSATRETGYKIQAQQLANCLSERTRLLVINSPSNPTGVAYTRQEFEAIGEVLRQYPQVIIVTDDIYEHILWADQPFTNIVNACPHLYERSVVINGVSKAYAMTGWRIGYAAGPAPLIAAMKKIQSQSTSNPCSIAQAAAVSALDGDQGPIKQMVDAFHERHDAVLARVSRIDGLYCQPADGTFYLFVDASEWIHQHDEINDDQQLCTALLDQTGVAVVPGSAFGAPNHFRLSYASGMNTLLQAMNRFDDFFSQ